MPVLSLRSDLTSMAGDVPSAGHEVVKVIKKTIHFKISSIIITGYIVVLIIHNPFKLRQR